MERKGGRGVRVVKEEGRGGEAAADRRGGREEKRRVECERWMQERGGVEGRGSKGGREGGSAASAIHIPP